MAPPQDDSSARYTFVGTQPQPSRFDFLGLGPLYNWIFGKKEAPQTQYPDETEGETIQLIIQWYQWFHPGKTPTHEFIDRVLVNLHNVSNLEEELGLSETKRVRNEVSLTYVADDVLQLEDKKRKYRRWQTFTGVGFLVFIFSSGTVSTAISETVFRNDDGTRATIGVIVNTLSILLPVISGTATFAWEFPIARINVMILRLLNYARGYGSEAREFFSSREEKFSQYTGPTFNLFLKYLRQAGHGPQVLLREPEEEAVDELESIHSSPGQLTRGSRSNSLGSSVA